MKNGRIHIRVTLEEKELIEKRAWKARMSVSEYLIALAKEKPIIIIDDIARFIVEIIRVGTNLNQIARIANSQKFIKREHLEAVESFQNEITQIQQTLGKLLKKIDRAVEGDSEISEDVMEKENGNS